MNVPEPQIFPFQAVESGVMIEMYASARAVDRCYPPGEPRRVNRPEQQLFSSVYNGMVKPFVRHTAKGVIWYQGTDLS